ncbi:hypothetical protein HIM_00853 [Hirsutella minnesotensis 3608]|nr:hypothetical protein HIM_00853 [Hirsutella minnesotensis 3608]
MAHGYWKHLLNILLLAVNGKLNVLSDPREVLNAQDEAIARTMKRRRAGPNHVRKPQHGRRRKHARNKDRENNDAIEADKSRADKQSPKPSDSNQSLSESQVIKERRRRTRDERHDAVLRAFASDGVYRALHLTLARLFAQQLEADLAALHGTASHAKRNISLCAKWAPSLDRQHDRQALIASSIAEALHPPSSFSSETLAPSSDRQTYLRHARELYRRDLASLRAHLAVVERDLSAGTFSAIRYERVPSLAMNSYSRLFYARDEQRFQSYIDRVADGRARISGATLMPSTLVKQVRAVNQRKLWTLDNLRAMEESEWHCNTDFVKVFEGLLLPMAVANGLAPEDMVRRVFVFSDMHFDGAQAREMPDAEGVDEPRPPQTAWSSSYERIKAKFAAAGYEMPELVFWNLAGGAADCVYGYGDEAAPKRRRSRARVW